MKIDWRGKKQHEQHEQNKPPVRLSLSAVEQYFSLTANQPQPAYKPKNSLSLQTFQVHLSLDKYYNYNINKHLYLLNFLNSEENKMIAIVFIQSQFRNVISKNAMSN
jgi:hypothetical protein